MKGKKKQAGRGVPLKAKTIRRILELREAKLSMNDIVIMAKTSKGSVNNVLRKAVEQTVEGESLCTLSNDELLARFYRKEGSNTEPDFDLLKEELSQPGVNAQLLWEEYVEETPEGMSRSSFYERLRHAGPEESPTPSMHQVYKGGERLLIDYSGLKATYTNPEGKVVKVDLFVASWAASSYLYVEASSSQDMENWIASHARAFRYFGCAPTYLVPDNLKSGVTKADFYEPTINRAYEAMAEHYGCAVLPARARKPQDKAGVESNVKFVQTHILGRLRKRIFRSLEELNEAIRELLPQINDRLMQRYHRSRKERFDDLDHPHSLPLPAEDFYATEIKDNVRVGDDHHVAFRKHFYSVPWRLTGARIDLWYSKNQLQVYHDGERVACHPVSSEIGGYTTNDQHRPPNHLFMRKLNPLWILNQAEKIGPGSHGILRRLLEVDPSQCELAVRKGLGIVDLAREFSAKQVDAAVVWAFDHGQTRISDIRTILEQKLYENQLPPIPPKSQRNVQHENIRGFNHYHDLSTQCSSKEDKLA